MNSAIIVAAGLGNRFKSSIPKQFIKLNNKEILSFSVSTFYNHPNINEVIIVTNKHWLEHVKKRYPKCKITLGGKYRKDSTINGLNVVSKNVKNVLIHDSARPLISQKIISECLKQLEISDATAPILDSSDSLIRIDHDQIKQLNRTHIKAVQTPQCFKLEKIKTVLSKNINGTDEIGMMLKVFPSCKINFVKGSIENLKITTKDDLKIIESLII